ncbi:MAG: MBL fold metallo-hydrolase [Candidatus Methanofastidiosia archaeon]
MKIDVKCLVDNRVGFASKFWGEHGLSFLIKCDDFRILYDTGLSGEVLLYNLSKLEEPTEFDYTVLSYGHIDHTGGLKKILKNQTDVLNPDAFDKKYVKRNGKLKDISMPVKRNEISDDTALILSMKKGIVVICGCCHAGILNILEHVGKLMKVKVIAVIGGLHLVKVSGEKIEETAKYVRDRNIELYSFHCTDLDEALKLSNLIGNKFHFGTCGDEFWFEG